MSSEQQNIVCEIKPVEKQIKPKKSTTTKASDIYKKMEHRQHVYEKPDTYTGSCEPEDYNGFVITEDEQKLEHKIIPKSFKLTPAFYKCFDELLVNAHDHKKRMEKAVEKDKDNNHPVTTIKVNINDDNSISFYNDGNGIHVEYMEEHKMYPPELIFGSLLTSTNYDDKEERAWGGKNGYGAKLANIFSKKFEIETVCHLNKKKYYQVFTNNMLDKTEPIIKACTNKPYTKITWLPDYSKFKTELNDDIKQLIKRRVYDIAGIVGKTGKVYFNDKLVEIKNFEKYVELYLAGTDYKAIFDEGDGWQIGATASEDDIFQQVSLVNGINTLRGGTHVEYIADQIKNKLVTYLKAKKKVDIKPQIIKNQLRLFINAYKIINPSFDSQTKETLTTPKSKFGSQFEVSDKFITKLAATEIIEKIISQAAYKDNKLLSKTDGTKSKTVRIPKLDDANRAGTTESKDCTIIFTEGDSAKSMAIAGLSEIGRDYYGVYPLKGKILNVREAGTAQILNCEVLNNIKKILGLQNNKDYKKEYEKSGVWPLRYGKIMLMTDQDHDGSHIKGLMMNLFDSLWSSLLDLGFITTMVTPIVKAFKGTTEKAFYTLQDYDKWKQETPNIKSWHIKYYKGLGTSSTKEAKEYFKNLKVIQYEPEKPEAIHITSSITEDDDIKINIDLVEQIDSMELESKNNDEDIKSLSGSKENRLDLAFNKKRADDRKNWLKFYDRNSYPDFNQTKLTFGDFVDKELIHFSNSDNDRSIPSMMDGLKPSQRKVLYSAFKRNLTQEIKVSQLAGYVSENSGYHHGEVSLEMTIKGMAQDFVGSNNLNLLMPKGQFGQRILGGADAASARYIFTHLNKLTRMLFKKEDDVLCNYLDDDGFPIEPEYYYPILPALLINGSTGIGTGFSTDIPQYNPIVLADYVLAKIENKQSPKLHVWYRGFRGPILYLENNSYITKGLFERINDNTIHITELPIGTWTATYKEYLDKVIIERGKEDSKNFIKSYEDNSTECRVDITVKMDSDLIDKWISKKGKDGITELETKLKLTANISLNNMHVFNENGKIIRFTNVEDLINHWFEIRKVIYDKRREHMLNELKKELEIISNKVRFILQIIDNTIEIRNKKKAIVIEQLEANNYPKISSKDDNPTYDYLLGMDLYKLTEEEVDELKKKKQAKEAEYNTLLAKKSVDLWKEDILEFKQNYSKSYDEYMKEYNSSVPVKGKKTRKPKAK